MAKHIHILSELPYSGKTRALTHAYVGSLADHQRKSVIGSGLWLTPTHRSRREVLNQLSNETSGVLFTPNVKTFDQFAESILDAHAVAASFLNATQKRILVRSIIQNLAQEKRLKHFHSIHHTSGFLDLAVEFLSEIKRDEIWPDQLEKTFEEKGASAKDRELHLIYDTYQRSLLKLDCFDAEGRFWLARSMIREGRLKPFDSVKFVVVDGFSDFTRTQHEILELLAERVDRMIISLPLDSDGRRRMLFAKSERAFKRFEQSTAIQRHTITDVIAHASSIDKGTPKPSEPAVESPRELPAARIPAALKTIAEDLFCNASGFTPKQNADGLEIVSISGLQSEYEILAESIKKLLVSGVPADEIVVVFRSLGDVAKPLSHVWSNAGIPFACELESSLADWPLARFLQSVLRLETENWSYSALAAVLRSNYFRPEWGEVGTSDARSRVLLHLRQRNLLGGRSAIQRSLARQLEFSETDDQVSAEDRQSIRSAAGLVERLAELTEPFREASTLHAWLERLRVIIEICSPRRDADNDQPNETQIAAGDRDAGDRLFDTLFDAEMFLAEADPKAGMTQIAMADFMEIFSDLVTSHTVADSEPETGRVRVLNATQVRNLDVPYLFVAGLNEGSFPSSKRDTCLFSDLDRQWLNDQGVTLPTAESHQQDEMLLFYNVVTRARRKLTLSYCSTSSRGQPLFPSPFVTAIRSLFQPRQIEETVIERWTPVCSAESIITKAQKRTTALSMALNGELHFLKHLTESSSTGPVARNLFAAADANSHRFEKHGMTIYEGLLSEKSERWLRKHFDPKYQFSATQFENYAACPFRFLLSHMLQAERVSAPATTTNFQRRGIVMHEALSKLHKNWTGDSDVEAPGEAEGLGGTIGEQLQSILRQISDKTFTTSDLDKALHRLETELMIQWAELYQHQWDEYQEQTAHLESPPQPVALEVPFGNVQLEADDAVQSGNRELRLGPDDAPVYLRGRIDRVDVGISDGHPIFNVIDYKTGSPKGFTLEQIARGDAIQLALYALAVLRLNLVGEEAVPYQLGYWAIKKDGFQAGMKTRGRSKGLQPLDSELLSAVEKTLNRLLPHLADGMRSGTFPVYSRKDDCTSNCPYKTVCRVNQIRPLEETLEKRCDVSAVLEDDENTDGESPSMQGAAS